MWFRFSLQNFPETFLILRGLERVMVINVHWSSCNVPVILNEIWIFSTNFRKTIKCQILWKSGQREPSCSMRTDRQTDVTKLFVAFRNFSNDPEKSLLRPLSLLIALVCFSRYAAIIFLNSNWNTDTKWIARQQMGLKSYEH